MKALEMPGFVVVRQKGSHVILNHMGASLSSPFTAMKSWDVESCGL
ncbi:MAG: type II toxin-antitoxin system HicA family toxin [Methanomicrobiales archaeon]|nr:type II toxin-antitoxin system HicA family toxin [Methanomicrobiales archaeon]MDI6876064.1 type II toxin-antitoxin system HicA family toxin [Methanomicrobiales archaeon]